MYAPVTRLCPGGTPDPVSGFDVKDCSTALYPSMFYGGLGPAPGILPKAFTPLTNPNTSRYDFPPNETPWRHHPQPQTPNFVTGTSIDNLRVEQDGAAGHYKIMLDVSYP